MYILTPEVVSRSGELNAQSPIHPQHLIALYKAIEWFQVFKRQGSTLIPTISCILIPCILLQYWIKWYFCSEPLQSFQARRSVDGISLTRNYFAAGINPTRSWPFHWWIFPLEGLCLDIPLWGFLIRNYSATGIFPTRSRFFWCWDFPHSEDCLYALLMGFLPLGDGNEDLPTGPFAISLWESKPFAVGFSSLRDLTLLQGFFPLSPFDVLLIEFFLFGNSNTSLRAPLIWPTDGWTPNSFSLLGSCRIATPLLGFLPLGVDTSNLSMGNTPSSGSYWGHGSADRISPLGSDCEPNFAGEISPLKRPNSAAGIFPSEVRIATPLLGFSPLSRRIQSIDGWYSLLASFQFAGKRSVEPMIAWNIRYIHEGFLVLIIPSTN